MELSVKKGQMDGQIGKPINLAENTLQLQGWHTRA
jgi:hypothetical protein